MYKFSKTSLSRLDTCHADLQTILKRAIKVKDFSVICGHRSEEDQNEAFDKGFSKLKFPQSKHNKTPSLAVDIYPYDNTLKLALSGHPTQIEYICEKTGISQAEAKAYIKEEYMLLMGVVMAIAADEGIKLRFGIDWDGDGYRLDQTFNDYPHIELV